MKTRKKCARQDVVRISWAATGGRARALQQILAPIVGARGARCFLRLQIFFSSAAIVVCDFLDFDRLNQRKTLKANAGTPKSGFGGKTRRCL